MKLSIVTTLYQSANYVNRYYERVSKAAQSITDDYELIFVDDGSPDESLDIAKEITEKDSRVRVIELSKNYGHHRAMMVGLEYAVGERCFLIDCDLEEPPECLEGFWREIEKNPDVDMVYGVNTEAKPGGALKRFASKLFYLLFNSASYVEIPDNELVARLMTKRYVKALLAYQESELFIPGIWADVGFERLEVSVAKKFDGHSSYSFRKRLTLAVDAITSFSTKPLVYIFYLGTIMSSVSVVMIIYLLLQKILFGTVLTGWTSLIVSIYLIGGAILLALGVIGMYISRIFSEVKQRPRYLVKYIHQSKPAEKRKQS